MYSLASWIARSWRCGVRCVGVESSGCGVVQSAGWFRVQGAPGGAGCGVYRVVQGVGFTGWFRVQCTQDGSRFRVYRMVQGSGFAGWFKVWDLLGGSGCGVYRA